MAYYLNQRRRIVSFFLSLSLSFRIYRLNRKFIVLDLLADVLLTSTFIHFVQNFRKTYLSSRLSIVNSRLYFLSAQRQSSFIWFEADICVHCYNWIARMKHVSLHTQHHVCNILILLLCCVFSTCSIIAMKAGEEQREQESRQTRGRRPAGVAKTKKIHQKN